MCGASDGELRPRETCKRPVCRASAQRWRQRAWGHGSASPPPRCPVAPTRCPAELLAARAVSAIVWGATGLYAAVFCLLSLRQYQAYLPHALDLGNMAQTFWNTAHGHPFRFQNMRDHVALEAFGTETRLSFHVEPIIPFLSIIYLFYQHVETLLVMQTVAVASGAVPARLLARRHLEHPLAEVTFPLAYLLFPALEAANLDEFHPVTLAAPLLLWAFYFADGRRYTLFALCAVAAMGCKEEIGALVALMGLWIALRQGEGRFGAVVAALGVCWSSIALEVVIPHFHASESAYWARYLPPGYPVAGPPVTPGDVLAYWLHHPAEVLGDLVSEAKLSYLHRLFYPAGYLALLSPVTLLVGLPSLLLNLLSREVHMYGGLAHYSAELVPVVIVGSIMGTEWFCRLAARRLRLPYRAAVAGCCLYVLLAALVNHRANGFSPLAAGFAPPAVSAHDRLLDRALALIPPDASVSAQDTLDAHLGDRPYSFLYPDTDAGRVEYIALDATQPPAPTLRPCVLVADVTGSNLPCALVAGPTPAAPPAGAGAVDQTALLQDGHWTISFAQDGILLLKRRAPGAPQDATLPPQFFTFATPTAGAVPAGGPVARFGEGLELLGFRVGRVGLADLRNPDVVLTSWWRADGPLPARTRLVHYLADPTGVRQLFSDDQQATDWFPPGRWQPGRIYQVESSPLPVTTRRSGWIDVDLGVIGGAWSDRDTGRDLPVRVLRPRGVVRGVGGGRVLKVARIHASL